jgi:hypothetical protein
MDHIYQNIQGWFDFSSFYDEMVQQAQDDSHFVEIGTWKGKSTSYMAVEIANSQKKIQFDCVDTWLGGEEVYEKDPDIINGSLFETFTRNMKPVEGYYKPIRMTSLEACKLYNDESLDFVFIDGAHDYDSVRLDVLFWLPKVKTGKFLGGHDFSAPQVREAIESVLPKDKILIRGNGGWKSWLYIKE